MRAFRTFTVTPYLPEPLEPLRELAYNLWWAWDHDALDLLRRVDRDLWEETHHNPVAMIGSTSQERLDELAADDGFLEHLQLVQAAFREYETNDTWFSGDTPGDPTQTIGYFSLEYGLTDCVPIYSGGLGVLAADHLKSASDMGVPLVGVGLLYQEGYFRQYLNPDGWQQELYPDNDFFSMPVRPVENPDGSRLRISLKLAGREVLLNVWRIQVGRVPLYMLDSNVAENAPEDRTLTAQLYGGDNETRIRQEIILGIGGIQALAAMGLQPAVFHMNEGHSAFLALERARLRMQADGLDFPAAMEATSVGNVFTTHTPVPAGHDRFSPALMDKYFADYYPQLGLSRGEFLALGQENPNRAQDPFCMTVLAIRMSAWRNGVSRLHGEVSRRLWRSLWPNVPEREVPLGHVTNGVHTPSWISHDMAALFDRYLGARWRTERGGPKVWERVDDIPDTELWRTHERRRERLVAFARRYLKAHLKQRGVSPAELAQADEVLHPEALTIGFGRRFATYKRATLLLRNTDRLVRLMTDEQRPIQVIFAGKAHPEDRPGKELIRQIIHFARQPEVRHRIVFLEDYDMAVARYMAQGVDVWLNTPRRPLEASGTSGMKAAANGALNLSVLDGWWAEAYSPEVGWAIGRGEEYSDPEYQDEVESHALYDLLEKELVPLFYERGADGLPRGWIAKMKRSMRAICPVFTSNRMMREYTEKYYLPAIERWNTLSLARCKRARELAQWKQRVRNAWPKIKIEAIEDDHQPTTEVGASFKVRAQVNLGDLTSADVTVELYHGDADVQGALSRARTVTMQCLGQAETGAYKYVGELTCRRAGLHGYTVRILPAHRDLVSAFDVGPILWA